MFRFLIILTLLTLPVQADRITSQSEVQAQQSYKSLDRFKGQPGTSVIPEGKKSPFGGPLDKQIKPLKPSEIPKEEPSPSYRKEEERAQKAIDERKERIERELDYYRP